MAFPLVGLGAQIDIHGPPVSVAFGTSVTALPNGNIVVTDPSAAPSNIGAIYLFSSTGALISTLTGGTANDQVGSGGVKVVGSGNFVVLSPQWNGQAGAVTWVNGSTGLSGVVGSGNSLVGTTALDSVGGVTVLSNGNYVVSSAAWNNGTANSYFGAVTWANGNSGIIGAVSTSNSLYGTTTMDFVGDSVIALGNGNYVVASPRWNNGGTNTNYGAVTWGNGAAGSSGPVTTANSLVGTAVGDRVGSAGIVALTNGNYVVASSNWHNGTTAGAGAVTWANGTAAFSAAVGPGNSLVGTSSNDQVGYGTNFSIGGGAGIVALENGNYVVISFKWRNTLASALVAGAVTWGNGATGIAGPVSSSNSLVGTTSGDEVGYYGVTALTNGNYVVISPVWSGGKGAATWGNGSSGITGSISSSNSLVGTVGGAPYPVGNGGAVALTNGNYVVSSPNLSNGGVVPNAGAVTWGDGSVGVSGGIAAGNSLIGATSGDSVGSGGIGALADGNYVVGSPFWTNGATSSAGAASWGNGSTGTTGSISTGNSLVGSTTNDFVGDGTATPLSGGACVVRSQFWNNGSATAAGASTWTRDMRRLVGPVSAANSLVGKMSNDNVGEGVRKLSDGNYIVISPNWNNGAINQAGAVTLANGRFRLKGTIQAWNSVLGAAASGGASMVFDYDATQQQLIVGRPAENIVSLFRMDQIYADDFDP